MTNLTDKLTKARALVAAMELPKPVSCIEFAHYESGEGDDAKYSFPVYYTSDQLRDFAAQALVRGWPQGQAVAWQYRSRPLWGAGAPWGPWADCSEGSFSDYMKTHVLHEWQYETRALYTHPAPAPAQAVACVLILGGVL